MKNNGMIFDAIIGCSAVFRGGIANAAQRWDLFGGISNETKQIFDVYYDK